MHQEADSWEHLGAGWPQSHLCASSIRVMGTWGPGGVGGTAAAHLLLAGGPLMRHGMCGTYSTAAGQQERNVFRDSLGSVAGMADVSVSEGLQLW